jgi:hypothetical protein
LLSFISTVQSTAADNDVMVIGDLNAYGAEDPINILTGAGLVNQISRFGGTTGYSYVFDGEAGYLDHALATASLSAQINAATHWHINADEPSIIDYNIEFKQPDCATCGPDYYTATPYRASDHDPVLIGVNLLPPLLSQSITFTAPADRAVDSGTFSAIATASSGLTVTFASTTPAVCSATAPGNVTLLAVGICTLTADQPGNGTYAPAAQVVRSFNVTAALLTQTINFAPLADRQLSSGAFSATAAASSGLPVSIASQTPAVCSVNAGTVTLVATGTCILNANQAGNATYAAAATVSQSFQITGSVAVPVPQWALLLLAACLIGTGVLVTNRHQNGV